MKRKWIVVFVGSVIGAAAAYLGWLALPVNFLGALVMFAGLCYCMGGGLFLAFGRAPQPMPSTLSSDHTLLVLAPGALLVLLAAPLEYRFLPQVLPRGGWMIWLGTAILLFGLSIRIWTRLVLKEDYQGNLQVQPCQQLVTSGPYHWVRHPGYLGFIVMAVGLAVGFSSLIGLLGAILTTAGFLLRIRVEEQMLIQAFGEKYIAYAKGTGKMVPRFRTLAQSRKIGRKLE